MHLFQNVLHWYNLQVIDKLRMVYEDNLDNIDVFPGGLLEFTPKGPGPLFRKVIKDQFLRLRDGDRFWFENEQNG